MGHKDFFLYVRERARLFDVATFSFFTEEGKNKSEFSLKPTISIVFRRLGAGCRCWRRRIFNRCFTNDKAWNKFYRIYIERRKFY